MSWNCVTSVTSELIAASSHQGRRVGLLCSLHHWGCSTVVPWMNDYLVLIVVSSRLSIFWIRSVVTQLFNMWFFKWPKLLSIVPCSHSLPWLIQIGGLGVGDGVDLPLMMWLYRFLINMLLLSQRVLWRFLQRKLFNDIVNIKL